MNTHDDRLSAVLADGQLAMPDGLRTQILEAVAAPDAGPQASAHHLAQMNVARFRKPMDDPDMFGFVEMLDPINHQADAAPGLVWRLTGEGSNNATSITFYDDPLLLVNMSVWVDLESLRDYVYRHEHAAMVRRRVEWADPFESRHIVLWWVVAGHTPDVAEGDDRLRLLEEQGPTPDAFTFGQSFPPPPSA